jgi:hypothetical protein
MAIGIATRLAVVALPLYVLEELAQMPAYRPDARSLAVSAALCSLAAVGDVAIMLALWACASMAFRAAAWFSPPRPGRYVAVVAAAIGVNAVVEWLAVGRLGLWAYQPWQPALPPLGTGLMAVLQPVIVLPLVFWVAHRWIAHRRGTAAAAGESGRSS